MRKSLLIISGIVALSGYSAPARAQAVDYGSLESLFGEPITTSATGTPQRASDVAADMTIITADEIRRSGSRSIPEILSRVPGLDILQEGANTWDVGVRGYQQPYQPRLLVLIDGRQVFIDDYSRMNWDNLPVNIDDIRQIEVVKGASSALFGSNATGGVINIITYSPLYDKDNTVSASIGTQNEVTGDATTTFGLDGHGGVKFSAGGLAMDEFDTARPSGEVPGEIKHPYHRYAAQSSVFKVNNDLQINTEANYTDKSGNEADFVYGLVPIQMTSYSAGAGFNWQTPYGLIRNNNYINHYYLDMTYAPNITDANTLIVSQLEDQFRVGADNTFRAMLEYRHKDFKSNNMPYQYPQFAEDSYAIGGTWLWQITDKLSMTNALRLERNDTAMNGTLVADSYFPKNAYGQTYNTVSANAGLVYKMTNLDTLRATYGRGVQDPSEIENGYNNVLNLGGGVKVNTFGNPNLKPTVVEDYELGYDRKVPSIFSKLKFSTYYEINHDLIAYPTVLGSEGTGANGYLSYPTNVGDSQGWGGEIEIKGKHPSGFHWDASYSLAEVRDSGLAAAGLHYSGSAPEHHFRLWGGYTTGPWEFDAHGQYATSTDMLRTVSIGSNPTLVATAGYFTMGGRIGYKVSDHVTVAASFFNVTQDHLTTSAYPAIERQALLTLTGKF
ncbi:MAG: TonB-dependent receptor [Alphaproteobacteria bacterium]|nr:TonB-dependent receptor [Alphaproteobacteria bacterium]